MGPLVAPGGEIKMSIPGAGGEWGAGAQLLSMAAASSPLLPHLKAALGEIFSLNQAGFFSLAFEISNFIFAVTAQRGQSVCYRPPCESLFVACC